MKSTPRERNDYLSYLNHQELPSLFLNDVLFCTAELHRLRKPLI